MGSIGYVGTVNELQWASSDSPTARAAYDPVLPPRVHARDARGHVGQQERNSLSAWCYRDLGLHCSPPVAKERVLVFTFMPPPIAAPAAAFPFKAILPIAPPAN